MDAKRIQVRKRVAEIIDAVALLTATLQDQFERVLIGRNRTLNLVLHDVLVLLFDDVEQVEDEWDREIEAAEPLDLLYVTYDAQVITIGVILEAVGKEGFAAEVR